DAIAIGEQVLPKVGDALSPPVLEERLDSRKVFQPQRDRREVEHLRVVAEFASQPIYGVLIDLKGSCLGHPAILLGARGAQNGRVRLRIRPLRYLRGRAACTEERPPGLRAWPPGA